MSNKEIIKVHCVKHQYADTTQISVCGLDFVVHQGEKVALIGPNGAGKTTLLLHLVGLLKPKSGKIEVFGVNPSTEFSKIGQKIGVVFQKVDEQLIGPTVLDDIAFSLVNYGFSQKEIDQRTERVMKELRISHLKNKIVHYLSGGEKKKVAIAGALVLNPQLLILDEALAEIDPESTNMVLEVLKHYNQKYKTAILMATNQMDFLEKFADTIYLLENGKITFKGSFDELRETKKDYKFCVH